MHTRVILYTKPSCPQYSHSFEGSPILFGFGEHMGAYHELWSGRYQRCWVRVVTGLPIRTERVPSSLGLLRDIYKVPYKDWWSQFGPIHWFLTHPLPLGYLYTSPQTTVRQEGIICILEIKFREMFVCFSKLISFIIPCNYIGAFMSKY